MDNTNIMTEPWRPIDGPLLKAALEEAFGVGIVAYTDTEIDVAPAIVRDLAEYIEASEPFCDHSVGICSCQTIGVLRELRLWTDGRASCSECGGDGYVPDTSGSGYDMGMCENCAGKGVVTL